MDEVTISFPGIGIDNFTVDKVIFSVGIFEVRWYGLIITLGMVLAFLYAIYRARQEKISFDDMLDVGIFTIIFGVIGARLYYVLTTLNEGLYNNFMDVISIWNGGLAIYGGIIGGAIAVYIVCRIKKLSFFKVTDTIVPGVLIGQLMGRWGNFFNGEAYGYELLEGSPLYFIRMGLIPNIESSTVMHYFHPTFLYESLWNLVGFVIINALYKKKKFDGQVFFMYITWYGFGRMFIEGLRTDSLYVGVFRISQVVGFLCFVIGVAAIAYGIAKSRKLQLQGDDSYCGVYDKIVGIRETKAPYEWEKKSEKTVKENKKPEDTVEKENKSFNDYSTLLGDKKSDKEEKDDINKLS